jgi:hypothetical protein
MSCCFRAGNRESGIGKRKNPNRSTPSVGEGHAGDFSHPRFPIPDSRSAASGAI